MQGDMIPVIQSLKTLKASFSDDGYDKNTLCARRRWSLPENHSKGVDNNFNDGGSQFKEASEINTSHAQILDLLKSNSLQVKNYISYIILVNFVSTLMIEV